MQFRRITLMSLTLVTNFLVFNTLEAFKFLDRLIGVEGFKFPDWVDPVSNILLIFNRLDNG